MRILSRRRGSAALAVMLTAAGTGLIRYPGWNVGFSWPGSQAISQIWSAGATQSGAAVSVTNASYDGSLAAGGSTTFGLLGSGAAPAPLAACNARRTERRR